MANIQRWINAHGQQETEIDLSPDRRLSDLEQMVNFLVGIIGQERYQTWEGGLKMAVKYDRKNMEAALNEKIDHHMTCSCEGCVKTRKYHNYIKLEKMRIESGLLPADAEMTKQAIGRFERMISNLECIA